MVLCNRSSSISSQHILFWNFFPSFLRSAFHLSHLLQNFLILLEFNSSSSFSRSKAIAIYALMNSSIFSAPVRLQHKLSDCLCYLLVFFLISCVTFSFRQFATSFHLLFSKTQHSALSQIMKTLFSDKLHYPQRHCRFWFWPADKKKLSIPGLKHNHTKTFEKEFWLLLV